MKKILFLVLPVVAAAAVGFFFWRRAQAKAEADKPGLTTVTVARGPIISSVASTGCVVSNLDVDIKCKASGEIVKLPFDVSDHVKKDDLLLQLDPVDEQRAVDLAGAALATSRAHLAQDKQNLIIAQMKLGTDTMRANASLEAAKAAVQRTRVKADRLKSALAQSAATQEDYDTAENDATQAVANLELCRAQVEELKSEEAGLELKRQDVALGEAEVKSNTISLELAKQSLTDTKVIAPIDGAVAASNVQIGQIIASAISNVGGGTTVLTLSDLSRIFTLAAVDESDIGQVRLNQPVRVTADAYPGKKFQGKVVRIATRGTNVSNVVTFEVKIEILDENKALLKPQMTTNVQIILAQKDDALLVPADAVTRKKGERTVQMQKGDGGTEDRAVTVGITDGNNTEVTGGLKEGEVIAYKKGEGDSRWRANQQQNRPPPMMFGGGGGRR